jgi:hypothetical protein
VYSTVHPCARVSVTTTERPAKAALIASRTKNCLGSPFTYRGAAPFAYGPAPILRGEIGTIHPEMEILRAKECASMLSQ